MKNLKKHYRIKALPEFVYKALTNPISIEMWSGSEAVMEEKAGTEFSLWDGDITGLNLEFTENQKIVQQWYFEGQEEKSLVTITLTPEGRETRVEVLHINIPDEAFENIVDGWDNYYFKPLKKLVEE